MKPVDSSEVELEKLIGLFFDQRELLGEFDSVNAQDLKEPAQSLLNHSRHMTVTIERHHGSPVDVRVLRTRTDDDFYSREILLTCQSDDKVVQYGIVRLDRSVLSDPVRAEIESQQTPLGRVLIEHDVLREVKLEQLYSIHCGPALAAALDVEEGKEVSGRTAMIYCDGQPVIELLEIVSTSVLPERT